MKHKLFLAFLLISTSLTAQNFRGGITGGAVISQYHGDLLGGYNKLGYKAGVVLTRETQKRVNYQLELYFIQKGSKYVGEDHQGHYNLRLRYIEVPLSLQYLWKGIHLGDFINLDFNTKVYPYIGLSAAYLLDAKEDNDGGGLHEPMKPFFSYDISGHLGISAALWENIILDYRISQSILPVREHPGGQTYWFDRGELNKLMSLGLIFYF